jgi:hypothetical protein
MPDFLFLDRVGQELGVIRGASAEWEPGAIVERPSGVLEVIVPLLEDVEGVDAYVLVEPARSGEPPVR